LCGCCLFFASSQLVSTLEDPTAVKSPGLGQGSVSSTGQVCMGCWGSRLGF
jgi:hypothetical protein